ncbi:hypothetical protein [Deefgea sp. CFH1-16]|uniref:hypothetical protein n=1 Tax=Deefgea sp. CFH1-16 TaxID=2675457 RepID=UPI0015F4E2F8|nr:hypothetical protein [Deefgea sp. CFH1-16]MBM5574631.1 hypothetical protein [Deefgea sp. CFH1-16]
MAMFEIEDSKDVELHGNKTNTETLAKIKNVTGLVAENNEVTVPSKAEAIDDIFEFKPNINGIGVNLNALWRKIKN